MNHKKIRIIILSIFIAASLFFLLEKAFLPGVSNSLYSQKSFKIIATIVSLIKDDYIEEPNPSKTMNGAFKGLVSSLDNLSGYLDKDSVAKYLHQKEPGLKETGAILYKKEGPFPLVIGVKENSPAAKKGIKTGDMIGAFDNKTTMTMSMLEANLYLKDTEGAPVNIKIIGSQEDRIISVEKALLSPESYLYSTENGTSGILKIQHLYPPCVDEIKKNILSRIKVQQEPLILDLRNCAEGEIEEAQKFVNLFLQAKSIGYLEKKGDIIQSLSCQDKAELDELPLIIWTNQATLGPAEVVAGVLKKHKKAKIIGLPTLGLVAKQDFFPFEDGSGLVLTSAIYHLDSENEVWHKGITPDHELKGSNHSLDVYLKETRRILPKI